MDETIADRVLQKHRAVIAVLGTLLLAPMAASAATITVNSTADSTGGSQCTLRDAIAAANNNATSGGCVAGSGADTIKFAVPNLSVIKLTSKTPLVINSDVSIVGPGQTWLAIDGVKATRVFEVDSGTVAISGLTIQNGFNDTDNGGGIYNNATLSVSNCALTKNIVGTGGSGGGIYNETAATLTVTNCALTGNVALAGGFGGAIANEGTLQIANSVLTGNSATEAGLGGAIYNDGTADIANSSFQSNKALGDSTGGFSGYGGAIYSDGTATLTNCTVAKNSATVGGFGGGIENEGTLTVDSCLVQGNTAAGSTGAVGGVGGSGGGISNSSGGLTVRNSRITANKATAGSANSGDVGGTGGGIENGGIAVITDSTVDSNFVGGTDFGSGWGGGVANLGGTLTVSNCTVSKNTATAAGPTFSGKGGGVFTSFGTATLNNSTIAKNTATNGGLGGGVYVTNSPGAAIVTNCTIDGNVAVDGPALFGSGGGIYVEVGSSTAMTGTIIAANGGTSLNCQGGGTFTSNGHNLSDDTCAGFGGTDLPNTNPLLAPLGFYGGPTATMALCSGAKVPVKSCSAASPAIDAGDDTVTGPPHNLTLDQRGQPRLSGSHVDIGAYEAP